LSLPVFESRKQAVFTYEKCRKLNKYVRRQLLKT